MSNLATPRNHFRFVALALSVAAVAVFVPLWAPLVLAAWIADLVRPLERALERAFGGRRAAAGGVTVALVLGSTLPLVIGAVVALVGARDLVFSTVRTLTSGGEITQTLGVEPSAPFTSAPRVVLDLLREHGATVWRVAGSVASVSMAVVVGVGVFGVGLYAFSVQGWRLYAWLARRSPLDHEAFSRLVGAFRETGRGLLVGAGGTAVAQGVVAGVAYAALGVSNAATLGALTGACSFVPGVGTALVWLPVSFALAMSGHTARAGILVALGIGVIGMLDNVLRPWLARAGKLRLPMLVVFLAMVGGLRLFGVGGIILGPLVVRLAVEALAIVRERRLRACSPTPHRQAVPSAG